MANDVHDPDGLAEGLADSIGSVHRSRVQPVAKTVLRHKNLAPGNGVNRLPPDGHGTGTCR